MKDILIGDAVTHHSDPRIWTVYELTHGYTRALCNYVGPDRVMHRRDWPTRSLTVIPRERPQESSYDPQ